MARICLLTLITGLLLDAYGLETPEENTGAVFVSQQSAHQVLIRQRRYNSGHLEELQRDNLERECKEETCTMEEAREVFEDYEKTMKFWAGYIDGDQCTPSPCQNGGVCEDAVNAYVCWCKPNFSGKNCEIEVAKQCTVNNGGCSHFCVMKVDVPVCRCAAGYTLGQDKKTCEPTGQFSCGRLTSTPVIKPIIPRSRSRTHTSEGDFEPIDLPEDDYIVENITEFEYDYDLAVNDSDPVDNNSAVETGSLKSESNSSVTASSVIEAPRKKRQLAFFPTLPTIKEKDNNDQRIVGGDEAIPGEIPWQVALMAHSQSLERAMPFCGGSLLSDLWVITAAHCLFRNEVVKQTYFVRVGEHDVLQDEGPERDHAVAEHQIHHKYNYQKSQYDHDIALLKLANPVELSNQRRPICLGPKDFIENLIRESTASMVSGWGRLKFLGAQANKLQKLNVPYVDRTLCKQSSQDHITPYMFCAGFESEQKDSCQGDSGGPHATNYKGTWFLTGIVSWGEECAKDGKYGIYTRVSRYYRWISQKTGIQVN
ncbi:hypothetical protein PAMA_006237 [Pampus argenteus]